MAYDYTQQACLIYSVAYLNCDPLICQLFDQVVLNVLQLLAHIGCIVNAIQGLWADLQLGNVPSSIKSESCS
jgi:hypothetical protein